MTGSHGVTYPGGVARKLPEEIRRIFAEYGRQGGLVGGKARWQGLTVEERREVARKAVLVRWKRYRAAKKKTKRRP